MDPECRCYPADDVAFVERVAACQRDLPGRERTDPDALQRALSRWYPRVAVHRRSRLGSLQSALIFYVFRDGSAVGQPGEG